MGVQSRIVLFARDPEAAREAAAAAFDRIAALEQAMSDYRADSELSLLTLNPVGHAVPLGSDLLDVLAISDEVSRATDGAFDVTMGPVVKLWRQARRSGEAPDQASLSEAWGAVGFDRLTIDRETRSVTLGVARMSLDLGGIGKGYAAQRASELLRDAGHPHHLVALAGDIVLGDAPMDERGVMSDGWRIEIETGLDESEVRPRVIRLKNAAVSTSGDSVQFFEIDGVRYSHLIDGRLARRAGEPTLEDQAFGSRRGVTVVSERGEWSDALGTVLAILGPEWLEAGDDVRLRALLSRFGDAWALLEWESAGVLRSVEAGRRR